MENQLCDSRGATAPGTPGSHFVSISPTYIYERRRVFNAISKKRRVRINRKAWPPRIDAIWSNETSVNYSNNFVFVDATQPNKFLGFWTSNASSIFFHNVTVD